MPGCSSAHLTCWRIADEDVRLLPLSMHKANLDRLLRGRPDGIFVNPFETGAIGPDPFKAACAMGLVEVREGVPVVTPIGQNTVWNA